MNPSGLLRTLFSSVLALLLTGGLMAAQAQTVVVDQDGGQDETTISAGLETLADEDDTGDDDDQGTLVIVAGDYTGTDADVDLGAGNDDGATDIDDSISNLTVEVRRDQGTNTDQLTLESLSLSEDGAGSVTEIDVTLQTTNGSEFIFLESGGGSDPNLATNDFAAGTTDLILEAGTLTLDEADVLQVQDDANGGGDTRVFRAAGGSIAGEAPNYAGDIDIEYHTAGSDIDAGNELGTTNLAGAQIDRVGELQIDDGGGAVDLVSFNVTSLEVDVLDHVNDDLQVDGDFVVNDQVDVPTGTDLEVTGVLTINTGAIPFLAGDGSVNSDFEDSQASAGNLSFDVDRGALGGDLVDIDGGTFVFNDVTVDVQQDAASGTTSNTLFDDDGAASTLQIGGTLTVNPVDDGDSDNDIISEEILAGVGGSTFDVNDVAVGSIDDSGAPATNTEETLVDVLNNSGATIIVGGELNDVENGDDASSLELTGGTIAGGINGDPASLDNDVAGTDGTVSITGDVTYDFTSAATIDNAAEGTIDIASGATLTIDDSDSSDDTETVLDNNGVSGVTGSGTLALTGDFDRGAGLTDEFTITTAGGDDQELTSAVTTTVELFIEDNAAGASDINVGDLTAEAPVTFGEDSANDVGNITVGNLTVNDNGDATDDVIQLATTPAAYGTVTVDGNLTANGEEVDFSLADDDDSTPDADVTVTGDVDINESNNETVVNFDDVEAHLEGSLDRQQSSLATFDTDGVSEIVFTARGDATFSPGSLFDIDGDLTIDKTEASVTITEAVAVNGDLTVSAPNTPVSPNNELILDDNLFVSGAAASHTIDSRITANNNFLIVDSNGPHNFGTNEGETLDNLRVNVVGTGTADDVQIATDLGFRGTVELLEGGIEVDQNAGTFTGATSADFFPTSSGSPLVRRDLSGTATTITTASGSDFFNDAGNAYDLAYTGGAEADVAAEFSGDVNNVTVENAGTIPRLIEDESIAGVLTVQSGAEIQDSDGDDTPGGDPAVVLELTSDGQTHSIVGRIEDDDGNTTTDPITLDVTGSNVTINGSTDDGNASTIQNLTATGSGLTVSDIQQVDGDVTVPDGGSLTIGLSDAAGDGLSAGVAGPNDQSIEGQVTANDQLTLASDIEVTANTGADAVQIDDAGSNGALDFGSFDLTITGGGAQFDGGADASYSSSGGALIFNDQSGGANNGLGTAGVAIPRVQIATATDVDLAEDAATDVLLDVDAALGHAGNDFEVSGDVELAADVSSGAGVFRSVGTDITLEADQSIDRFTVDSGSGNTTTLLSDDPDTPRDLDVDTQFILNSGEFAHGQNDLSIMGGADGFTYVAGSVSATSGFVDLETGGGGTTFDLDQALTIPNLRVTTDADLGDDDVNLTVGSELELDDNFDGTTSSGDIVMADGALVHRLQGTNVNGVEPLEEALAAAGTYDVTYGEGTDVDGDVAATGDRDYNSGFELDANNVSVLTVNAGEITDPDGSTPDDEQGTVFLDPDEVTGDVNVDELVLNDGNLDYGRQVVIADGGTVTRRPGSVLADEPNGDTGDGGNTDDPAALGADGTFALVYDGDDGAAGGTIDASPLVFTSDVSSVETTLGDATVPFDHSVDIDVTRTISRLTVSNVTAGSITTIDGVTLTVDGDVTVNGGELGNSPAPVGGTLAVSGNVDVDGAELSTDADVEGNTTVRNDGDISSDGYRTAGDFVVESGDLLGGPAVTFDGDIQDLTFNSGAETLSSLTMDQQDADSRVFLTGDQLNLTAPAANRLIFNDGLLVVPDSEDPDNVFVNLSDPGNAPNSIVPVDHSPNTLSHVVGRVDVGIPAGTPGSGGGNDRGRYVFPVGSTSEYRPASFTFRTDDPIEVNVNIRISHVNENPGGTNGLEDIEGIAGYPQQYWLLSADQGLGSSQQFDLELETGTAGFVDRFEDADNLRIIRRFGDVANDWIMQGDDANYDNNLFIRNNNEVAAVRTQKSTGGVTQQDARFTIGLPGRIPEITASSFDPADLTISENETLTAQFRATSQDAGQAVTLDTTDIPADAREFITETDVDTDSTATDSLMVEFTPDNSFVQNSSRDVQLAVRADDPDGFVDSTFTVTVEDVNRAPAFVHSVPDSSVAEGDSLGYIVAASDADGDALSFSLSQAPDNASVMSIDDGLASWLNADQSTATSSSNGSGNAAFKVNTDNGTITSIDYNIELSGLDFSTFADAAASTSATGDDVLGLHIHNAARGETGGIEFGILGDPSEGSTLDPTTSDDADQKVSVHADGSVVISGSWDPDEASNPDNFAGSILNNATGEDVPLYVNLHTSENKSGEIRGQVTVEEAAVVSFTPVFEQADDTHSITVQASDGSDTASATASIDVGFSITLAGDASGNGSVSAQDASLALQFFLGKTDLSKAQQRVTDVEYVNGDLELRDNGITAFDASQILMEALDTDDGSSAALAVTGDDAEVSGSVQIGEPSTDKGTTTLPLVLSEDASGVTSVSVTMKLESGEESPDVSTSLPEDWIADHNVLEDGTLKIGMAGPSALPSGEVGTIVLKRDISNAQDVEVDGEYRVNTSEKQALKVNAVPDKFALKSNYPNPFSQQTTIEYKLKKSAHVTITVFDMLGRKVGTLVNEKKSAGTYTTTWNASGQRSVGSGVYFYRIDAGDFKATKRMTVVR